MCHKTGVQPKPACNIYFFYNSMIYVGIFIGVNPAGDAGDVSPPIFWLVGTSVGMSPPIFGVM